MFLKNAGRDNVYSHQSIKLIFKVFKMDIKMFEFLIL